MPAPPDKLMSAPPPAKPYLARVRNFAAIYDLRVFIVTPGGGLTRRLAAAGRPPPRQIDGRAGLPLRVGALPAARVPVRLNPGATARADTWSGIQRQIAGREEVSRACLRLF